MQIYFTSLPIGDMPPAPSREAAELHDKRMHYVHRQLGVRELLESRSDLVVIDDSASKQNLASLRSSSSTSVGPRHRKNTPGSSNRRQKVAHPAYLSCSHG